MKALQNVAFVLENGQELWFQAQDFLEFDFQSDGNLAIKVGENIISSPMLRFVSASIDARANHTYPIQGFSTLSSTTNFTTLMEAYDLALVLLESEDGVDSYFVTDGAELRTELDKFGNLILKIDSNSVVPIEPPEMPF